MLEIVRMLCASTGHITKSDAGLLATNVGKNDPDNRVEDDDPADPVVAWDKAPYGWFVWVPSDFDIETDGEAFTDRGYSLQFLKLLELARKNDCDWINLDCDGPEIAGLESVQW